MNVAAHSEGLFLFQIVLLVVVGRLLGELMVRIGQPSIMGQIIGGILLGPSILGSIAPGIEVALFPEVDAQKSMTEAVAQLGILFLLLLAGLKTDLGVLLEPDALVLTIGLILVASIGKFGGAFVGARLTGLTSAEAIALGSGMNARGSTEVIIATIGLAAGVLNQQLFSAIVAMALVTTMAMPATLRWALRRLPMREDEETRLRKEDFEASSFLNRFERPLLAVDLSPASQLAGRLAAAFAMTRKTPLTILSVNSAGASGSAAVEKTDDKQQQDIRERTEAFAATLRETPAPAPADGKADEVQSGGLHVTARTADGTPIEDVLEDSAEKGHDLLFVGIDPVSSENGGFAARVSRLMTAFGGTVAVVASREGRTATASGDLRILIPISDTERSIRAVEFGCAIARSSGAAVAVIYILEPNEAQQRPRFGRDEFGHAAAFERVDEIAEQTGVKITKTLQEGNSAEVAILRHARRGRYNLLVVGVSRRAGDRISYGRIADNLLDAADRSIVFIETEQP